MANSTNGNIFVPPKLDWETENILKLDDVTFTVGTGEVIQDRNTNEKTFFLGKSKRQLECITDIQVDKPIQNIFDLGIYRGGSVMFYYKYFNPKKLIAIELSANPIGVLDNYIQKNRLNDVIRTHYGVDQSDAERLHKIVDADLQGQTLDLIVDDASHFLDETRISFNTLFPYLSAGGHYIIEDWGWAQWPGDKWQKDGGPWPQRLPLTNLILELTLLAASRPDLIDSIFLRPAYAIIRKGRGACEPGIFDLVSNCNNRGNPITLLS